MKHKLLLFALLLLSLASVLLVACGLATGPDLSGVAFKDGPYTVTYGEALPTMEIDEDALPGDVVLKGYEYYSGSTKISRWEIKDTGVYTIKAILEDTLDKTKPLSIETTLTINKAPIDVSGVLFEGKEEYYDGGNVVLRATQVPRGVKVDYTINGVPGDRASAIGVYTVVAMLSPEDPANYVLTGNTVLNATLKIKGNDDHDMSGIGFVGGPYTVTYGDALPAMKINEADLPEGVTVGYQFFLNGNRIGLPYIKDAGTYTVKAVFTNTRKNYNTPDPIETTLTIKKAKLDVTGFTFADVTKTYTGNAYTIEADGYSEYATVAYTVTKGSSVVTEAKAAGRYTVTAAFTITDNNYEFKDGKNTLTAALVIEPKAVDVSGVVFGNTEAYYTGSAISHGITLDAALADKVDVSYTIGGLPGNSATEIGAYTVVATLTPASGNYTLTGTTTLSATLTIKDGEDHDMTGIGFVGGPYTLAYGDELPELKINESALPEGVTLVGYEYYLDEKRIELGDIENAGTYTVKAIFANSKENYKTPAPIETTVTIEKVKVDVDGFTFVGDTVTYNGKNQIITASDYDKYATVEYNITEAINAGTYTVTATFALTDSVNYEFENNKNSLEATLVIETVKVNVDSFTFVGDTVTYNGKNQIITASGYDKYATVEYNITEAINAGTYTVTATFALIDSVNYEFENNKNSLEATLVIETKEVDVSGIVFEDKTVVYYDDVETYTHGVSNLPEGVVPTYTINGESGNTATALDTYIIVATLAPENGNYVLRGADATGKIVLPSVTFKVIEGYEHDGMDSIVFVSGEHNTITYGDTIPNLTINEAALPKGEGWAVTVKYEYYLNGNLLNGISDIKDAGTYTVKAVFTTNRKDFKNPTAIETALVIEPKPVNVGGFVFTGTTVTYTGSALTPDVKDLPDYLEVEYSVTDAINAGTYDMIATFKITDSNYVFENDVATREVTLVIEPKPVNVGGFVFTGTTVTYTGSALTPDVKDLPDYLEVEYSVTDAINAGTYDMIATFKITDSNYVFENDVATREVTLVIAPKPVTLAELGLAWNYANMAGYDAAANAIRVAKDATFSYEMTLDAASLEALAEKGITVTYTTVKVVEDGTEAVTGAVTLRGNYTTTATFTCAEGGNYKIADTEGVFEIDWVICSNEQGSWTPIVKPE